MVPWKSRRRRAAYSRLVRQISEHDVVWAAEKVVGTAWMATLAQSEEQAAAAPDGPGDRHDRLREFAERERARWEQARRIRTLEILADRDRLAAVARDAGKLSERR